jgi:tetratricopeptide (TPR) repeat protein
VTPETPPPPAAPLPALASYALCGAAALLLGLAAQTARQAGLPAPDPYIWSDVALAFLLGALPAGVALASTVRRRLPPVLVIIAGISSLFLAWSVLRLTSGSPALASLARPLVALGLALAAALFVAGCTRRPLSAPLAGRASVGASVALSVAALWLVPAAYAATRVRHHAAQLEQLLDEARLAEAARLARALSDFDPTLRLDGTTLPAAHGAPIRTLAPALAVQVRTVEERVANPLPADASDDDRLARAADLALLGRESEALPLIEPLAARESPDPAALDLLGMIHETREDYPAARSAFDRAAQTWEAQPDSPERTAGLAQAVRGIAYAERKLGHYPQAETAYQRLLELSPTADTHFLLAKFYEDTQQAPPAREHARRAMRLAPDRYGDPGRELIDSLAVRHFGCFSVYAAERSARSPGAVPR